MEGGLQQPYNVGDIVKKVTLFKHCVNNACFCTCVNWLAIRKIRSCIHQIFPLITLLRQVQGKGWTNKLESCNCCWCCVLQLRYTIKKILMMIVMINWTVENLGNNLEVECTKWQLVDLIFVQKYSKLHKFTRNFALFSEKLHESHKILCCFLNNYATRKKNPGLPAPLVSTVPTNVNSACWLKR